MKSLSIPEHALSLGDDMRLAVEAAAKAGDIIREGYGKKQKIEQKGIGDLVSRVDREADIAICKKIRKRRPDGRIISEEMNPDGDDQEGATWIVDPLDASAGFLFEAGPEISSVLIALRKNLKTVLGVVLFPLTKEWFYAVRGKGAFKNGKRLQVPNTPTDLSEAWVDMNQYADARLETENFKLLRQRLRLPGGARLVTTQVPHSGIAMRVVEGKSKLSAVIHDNNPRKVKQERWDVAAPQVVLEEAGGVFLDAQGNDYNPFEPGLIIAAANRQIADTIRSLLPETV